PFTFTQNYQVSQLVGGALLFSKPWLKNNPHSKWSIADHSIRTGRPANFLRKRKRHSNKPRQNQPLLHRNRRRPHRKRNLQRPRLRHPRQLNRQKRRGSRPTSRGPQVVIHSTTRPALSA